MKQITTATDLITETHKILTECPKDDKGWSRRRIIPILGTTGVGKSTLSMYLSGTPIFPDEDDFGRTVAMIKGENANVISHGMTKSHTLYPRYIDFEYNEVEYSFVDLPGVLDSRGPAERLSIMAKTKEVLESAAEIPALLVVLSLDSFSTTNRSQSLIETAMILANLFNSNPKIFESTYFVISKAENLKNNSYIYNINSTLRQSIKKAIFEIVKFKNEELKAVQKKIANYKKNNYSELLAEQEQIQSSLLALINLLSYIHQNEGKIFQGNVFDGGQSRTQILETALAYKHYDQKVKSKDFNFNHYHGMLDHLDYEVNEISLKTLPLLRKMNRIPRQIELAECERERAMQLQAVLGEQLDALEGKQATVEHFTKSAIELKIQLGHLEKTLSGKNDALQSVIKEKNDLKEIKSDLDTEEKICIRTETLIKPASFYWSFWSLFGYEYDGSDKSIMHINLPYEYDSYKTQALDNNGYLVDVQSTPNKGEFAATYCLRKNDRSVHKVEFYQKKRLWKTADIQDLDRQISELETDIAQKNQVVEQLIDEITRLKETIDCIQNHMNIEKSRNAILQQVKIQEAQVNKLTQTLVELHVSSQEASLELAPYAKVLDNILDLDTYFGFQYPLSRRLLRAFVEYKSLIYTESEIGQPLSQDTALWTDVGSWEDIIKKTQTSTMIDDMELSKIQCSISNKIMDNPSYLQTCGDWFELSEIENYVKQQAIAAKPIDMEVLLLLGESAEAPYECPKCHKGFAAEDIIITGQAIEVMRSWIDSIKHQTMKSLQTADFAQDTLEEVSQYHLESEGEAQIKRKISEILERIEQLSKDKNTLFQALKIAEGLIKETEVKQTKEEGPVAEPKAEQRLVMQNVQRHPLEEEAEPTMTLDYERKRQLERCAEALIVESEKKEPDHKSQAQQSL